MSFYFDAVVAVRSLIRRPGFALVSILTIALAIAANTAIFSVVDAVLLRPLPFRDPDRQVTIDGRGHTGFLASISVPDYRDWRDRNRVFESFAGSAPWAQAMTGRGPAERVSVTAVAGDFFGTLGLTPAMGRALTAAETPAQAGGESVVVVGHQFWTEALGQDPAIVGQSLVLGRRPYTIVGVLAAGAGYPDPKVQVYMPMSTLDVPWDDRGTGFGMRGHARLKPGVRLVDAQADLDRVWQELRATEGQQEARPELQSLQDLLVGDVRRQLWVLMGSVGFVLLIAVANVANLLLARGEGRQKELAVRSALGATGRDLTRLLVTEAMVLAIVGGTLGLGLAYLTVGALIPFVAADIPGMLVSRIHVDARIVVWGLGITLLTGLVFGAAPAVKLARAGTSGSLGGTRTTERGHGRLREALVVAEVALALVLLVSAGLMIRSLDRLTNVDKGFVSENILSAALSPNYAGEPTEAEWLAFYDRLRTRAAALPGVRSAALALLLPLSERSWELLVHPEGVPVEPSKGASVLYNVVSPEYFSTLGVPILRGRGFTEGDRVGSELVAIIDDTMAARFWPGQDPLGKRLTFDVDTSKVPIYRTVIGVTRNVRHYALKTPSRIQVYVPAKQTFPRWGMGLRVVLRTEGASAQLVAPLRTLAAELAPERPLFDVKSVDEFVGAALSQNRATTRVLTGFAAAALVLAALGIFGVMSYAVARQTREIGIRMALGADASEVMRWIGRRALLLTTIGIAIGVAGTAALTQVLGSLLFEVSPLDPATFLLVALVLAGTALAAAFIPALRATRVNPVTVLSAEA